LTTETGTGLFHTAPSNWLEDFFVGQNFGLEIPKTFGQSSLFQTSVPLFAGANVYTVNPQITEFWSSEGALLSHTKILHNYPPFLAVKNTHYLPCNSPMILGMEGQ
jgi:isoleucyl-tRNA synthetase